MAEGETMSGVLLVGHGGPEMLEWRDDLARPVAGPGDVVVRVHAAGVNNTDVNTRIGWYDTGADDDAIGGWGGDPLVLPRIQGADVCGTVVEIGEGVDGSRLGDRVLVEPVLREANGHPLESPWYLGSECDGGFAQYLRVASRHAHSVDSSWSDVELASFPCSSSTALNLLTRSAVGPDDTVLVTGASGGVGSAAVQLAASRGATVIAVCAATKAHALIGLGASRTVDRGVDLVEALGARSVDVVIDLVGGPQWPSLLDVLRSGGRYAVSGAIAGHEVTLDLRTLYLKDLSFFGCTIIEPTVFAELVTAIEDGAITPVVAATFPLREIGRAQAEFGEKAHTGKIVLTVD